MSRGPDAATLLTRALAESATRAGCPVRVARADWTRWESATFTGARHTLALIAPASPAFDDWLAALPDAELKLQGHLVADVTTESVHRFFYAVVAVLEVLTVEER